MGACMRKANAFNYDVAGSNQTVRIVANTGRTYGGSDPPTLTGVNTIAYWATVTATQTVPTLFASLGGNATNTVSANATAAVVAETVPGSFYGLDQTGDCLAKGSGVLSSGALWDCGVDIDVAGNGSTAPGCPGSSVLCGPDGIYLSSECNGGTTSFKGCVDSGNSENYAGQSKGPGVVSSGATIQVYAVGAVDNPSKFTPTPTNGASLSTAGDPFNGKTQPPIVANTATCALPSANITGGTSASPTVLGPYQYFVAVVSGGVTTYTGARINLGSGYYRFDKVANGGTCPGTPTGTPPSGAFPGYQFYGGLNVGGTVYFTDGQYVMAGATTSTQDVLNFGGAAAYCANPPSCSSFTPTSSNTGMMIITTDGVYTGTGTGGLNAPPVLATLVASGGSCASGLCQGSINISGATVNLTGVTAANIPLAVGDFTNFDNLLLWQDRRNSTSTYTSDASTITPVKNAVTGAVTLPPTANHVTNYSPGFTTDDGNGSSSMVGVMHLPRGAWVNFQPGTGSGRSPLQLFAGAFITMNNGGNISGGNSAMTLQPLTNPTVVFKTALIQ